MHRMIVCLLGALLGLASCGNPGAKPTTPLSPMGKPGTVRPSQTARNTPAPKPDPKLVEPDRPPEDALESPEPIVQFWDTGNFLGGKPATLMLAVWRDGKVLRVLNRRAYIGYISNTDVGRLMDRLAYAGVESAPFTNGIFDAEGVSQLIYINVNSTEVWMRHDGNTTIDDLENYELPANITRPQMLQFMQIWTRASAALDDVWPLRLDLVTGMPAIPFPGIR